MPFFLNSMMALRTQKPLSRMTTYPLWNMGASIRSNNPTVEPMLLYSCCPRALGRSLPSTRSIPHMIPEVQQQTIWYSLPNGHGLQGTNMNPGHVNLFVQTLMLLSRQFTYPGTKFSTMLTPPPPPGLHHLSDLPKLAKVCWGGGGGCICEGQSR